MWTIFQVFIDFVTILLLLYILMFWPGSMQDPSSPTRIRPPPPALEGEALATGWPGKSHVWLFLHHHILIWLE